MKHLERIVNNIISILIIAVLIITMICPAQDVSFGTEEQPELGWSYSVMDDELIIKIDARSFNHISSFTYDLEYDADLLEYKSEKHSEMLANSFLSVNNDDDCIKAAFADESGVTISSGLLFEFHFKMLFEGTQGIVLKQTVSDCTDKWLNVLDVLNSNWDTVIYPSNIAANAYKCNVQSKYDLKLNQDAEVKMYFEKNNRGIYSGSFSLNFDSQCFSFNGVTAADGVQLVIDSNQIEPGKINVAFSTTELFKKTGAFIGIHFIPRTQSDASVVSITDFSITDRDLNNVDLPVELFSLSTGSERGGNLFMVKSPDSVTPDQEFQVDLNLTENSGFAALTAELRYNTELFEFISGDSISGTFTGAMCNIAEREAGTIRIGVIGASDIKGNGDFVSLTFKGKQAAGAAGEFVLTVKELVDENFNKLNYSCINSSTILAVHKWDTNYTVDKEPTCTEDGVKSIHCLDCDKRKDEVIIPATGHDLVEHEAHAATETENGSTAYWSCNRCGKFYSDANAENEIEEYNWVIEYNGHDYGELISKTDPDCTNPGMKAHYQCTVCRKFFDTDKHETTRNDLMIQAEGHDLTPHGANEATCESDGNSAYWSCSKCRKFFSDEHGETEIEENGWIIPAGHKYGELIAEKKAGCTEEGMRAHYKCSACQKVFDENKVETTENALKIQATGHTLTEHAAHGATCTVDGNTAYWSCSKCDRFFSDAEGVNEIPENSWVISGVHTYGELIPKLNAGCTTEGMKAHYQCSVCHSFFDESKNKVTEESLIIGALGHNLTGYRAHAATCTVDGNSAYWGCNRCGKYFSDKNATVEIARDSWIIPKAHSLTKHEASEALCEEPGNSTYWSCNKCGKFFSDENGEHEIEEYSWIIPGGHKYGDLIAQKDPTCTEPGMKAHYKCSVCGSYFNADKQLTIEEALVIPAAGHTLTKHNAKDATCTEAGNSAYWSCSVCGKFFSDEEGTAEINENSWILPAGHKYGELIAQRDPTCTEPGIKEHYECSVCHHYFDKNKNEVTLDELAIEASGHNLTEHGSKEATCDEPGNNAYWECDKCGRFFSDSEGTTEVEEDSWIIPGGHKYGDLIAQKNPTCTEPGMKAHYKCSVCSKYFDTEKKLTLEEALVIPAAGHTLMKHNAKDATCTEAGNSAYWSCSVCGKFFSDEEGTAEINENSWIIPAGHKYGELIAQKDPTCTEPGVKAHYECSVCHHLFDEDKDEVTSEELAIEASGHNLTEHKAKEATCDEPGNNAYWECDKCGRFFSDSEGTTEVEEDSWIIPGGHKYGDLIAQKNPTCTEPGMKAHYKCSACNKYFDTDMQLTTESALMIEALSHDLTGHAANEATCTEPGNNAYWSCSRCGKYFSDENGTTEIDENSWIIPAGHKYGELIEQQDPTCTEPGMKAHFKCAACGNVFDEDKKATTEDALTLDPTGHELIGHEAHSATETENGNSAYWECNKCGKFFSDEEGTIEIEENSWIIEAGGHQYGDLIAQKDPTCTESGMKEHYKCSVCNHYFDKDKNEVSLESILIQATGHDLTGHEAHEATCTEAGNSAYWSCSKCEKFYSDEEATAEIDEGSWIIPAGHKYGDLIAQKDATCTEPGVKAHYECSVCHHFFDEDKKEVTFEDLTIAASGHSLTEHKAKDATCTEVGNSAYWECSKCGKFFSDSEGKTEIAAHSWIIPGGHKYGDLIPQKDPTCTETGMKAHYKCSVCGSFFDEDKRITTETALTIKTVAHDLTAHAAKEATCTEAGNSAYWSCSKCHKFYSDEEGTTEIDENSWIIPAGHKYGDLIAQKDATCTEPGMKAYYQCSVCHHYFDKDKNEVALEDLTIAATGHELTEHKAKEATCTEVGNSAYWECSKCGKFFSDKEGTKEIDEHSWIIPGGHKYGDLIPQKDPTCTETGMKAHYKCSVCGSFFDEDKRITTEKALTIKTTAHDLTAHAAKEATCTETGNYAYWSCSKCQKFYSDEEGTTEIDKDSWIIPAGHKYGDLIAQKDATCTAPGMKAYYQCSVCHHYFDKDKKEVALGDLTIAASGHSLTEHKAKEATCTEVGNSAYWECSKCGKFFSDSEGKTEIAAHSWILPGGHKYGELIPQKDPTCTEDGMKAHYECSACGSFFDENKRITVKEALIIKAAHDLKEHQAVMPTCTEPGMRAYYKCSVCQAYFDTEMRPTTESSLIVPALGHVYGEWQKLDDMQHQRVCQRDASHVEKEDHKWDAGTITKEPTETEKGEKTYTCTSCNAVMTEEIPVKEKDPDPVDPEKQMGEDGTALGRGASAEAADKAITGMKNDNDPAGSKIYPLLIKSQKQSKSSVAITWSKPKDAVKYVIYGNKCGKSNRMKKLKTQKSNKITFKKVFKKVKKGTYYKFIVVSLDMNNNVVATSRVIHVATKGGKVGNYKSVSTKAKKNKVTIKKGKSFKLAGKGVPASKKLRVKKHVAIRYESENDSIAKVSAKGVIKGKKKGTTYVYAYCQSGPYARIKVTVK